MNSPLWTLFNKNNRTKLVMKFYGRTEQYQYSVSVIIPQMVGVYSMKAKIEFPSKAKVYIDQYLLPWLQKVKTLRLDHVVLE